MPPRAATGSTAQPETATPRAGTAPGKRASGTRQRGAGNTVDRRYTTDHMERAVAGTARRDKAGNESAPSRQHGNGTVVTMAVLLAAQVAQRVLRATRSQPAAGTGARAKRGRRPPTEQAGAGATLATAHGAFNVAGGLWPLLHLPSFEWVFGPKQDRWLQRTVGGLLVANGISQLGGAGTLEGQARARTIGVTTAATLLAIDLVYVPRGRIRPTYLLDAATELVWITAWLRKPT